MQPARFEIEPFFLNGEHGALFCIHHYPAVLPPKGGILYLHPFAEEMHKSRRMAALQARRFACAGYAVLQVDLCGCGDSAGDFADASWDAWLIDARLAHAWLSARNTGPIRLWGLRTGANLAIELANTLSGIEQLLLWQPVVNGEHYLNQFLRIKMASEMLSAGQTQHGIKDLRARLDAGESLEVGGYRLNATMARDLSRLKLGDRHPSCAVAWLELGLEDSDLVALASQRIVNDWRKSGCMVRTHTLTGVPFWLTQDITETPDLIEATSGCCQP